MKSAYAFRKNVYNIMAHVEKGLLHVLFNHYESY